MTRENYIKEKTETLLVNDALGVETKELRYKETRTLISSSCIKLSRWCQGCFIHIKLSHLNNPKYTGEQEKWRKVESYLILSNLRLTLFASSFPEQITKVNSCKHRHLKWLRKVDEEDDSNLAVDHKTLTPRFVSRPSAICHRRRLHDRRDGVYNRNARALSSPSFLLLGNWGERRVRF